jgi:Ca-activated chloride channel homolog
MDHFRKKEHACLSTAKEIEKTSKVFPPRVSDTKRGFRSSAIQARKTMKSPFIITLLTAAFGGLLPFPQALAQVDGRILIMPPFPPPRIEVRVPDIGLMQTREMSVIARVDGLHAVVETTLVFHNPNARMLEGELIFPLPDGAAVCGYALDIGGVLVDGVVVTKERARVAFETETRRNVDPGLVEHVQGNLYRTRIYPLPAKGERRIRLTYTTPLATAPNGDAALLLPMPREEISKLKVTIEVAAPDGAVPEVGGLGDERFEKAERIWRVESSSEKTTPGEDVLVALPKLPKSFHRIEREGDTHHFMITTVAPAAQPGSAAPGKIHVLWDASGSRAGADLTKEFSLLKQTKATGYLLTVFRDMPETAREFATVDELIAALKEVPYDGGTDIAALRDLPAAAHTLLFTDGLDTLSGKSLEFGGVAPIAIVSQTVANREALRQACAGALIDLQTTDPAAAWAEIESPSPRVTGVKGTGIANVQGIGKPAHGRIHLLGELTEPEASVRIVYADGTESEPFALRRADASEGRILATAWAAARVNQLAPRAEEFGDELLALGRSHGLVSPATSLIVLETLDQWVRHKIEPPASLPDMRRQWQQAMKGSANQNEPTQRLESIVGLWKQRVEWWKTDFSKAKAQPQRKKGEGRDDPRDATRAELLESVDSAFSAPPAPSAAADPFSSGDESPALQRRASGGGGFGGGMAAKKPDDSDDSATASIEIKPWSPDTPYLKVIRAAKDGQRYAAYLSEREKFAQSPAFFLDCAEQFYQDGDKALARRILTNLAELRIEDTGLLRVLAWRLQQAGELDFATVILRRVAKLRPEEPQSFRDLALALSDRGRATKSKADLEEAMGLFLKVALGTWGRHGESIPLFALEEMNGLIAWVKRQDWAEGGKPVIPEYDKRLHDNLDTDIRIVMSWDADATDMDLHVMEPGGEEASYSHNRTARGGLVSQDITDGYGPEEYLIRKAPTGKYAIRTNYFGSRQQTVVGPATVTATVFTNWGRANEERRVITIRLDKEKENIDIGTITFGSGESAAVPGKLRTGMTREEVLAIFPKPTDPSANPLEYPEGAKTLKVLFDEKGALLNVSETLPGGTETIILQ